MRRNCPRRCRLLIWRHFRRPRPRSFHIPILQCRRRLPSFRSFRSRVEVVVCHQFLQPVVAVAAVAAEEAEAVVAVAVVAVAVVAVAVVAVAVEAVVAVAVVAVAAVVVAAVAVEHRP
jgi:hypothetical protein